MPVVIGRCVPFPLIAHVDTRSPLYGVLLLVCNGSPFESCSRPDSSLPLMHMRTQDDENNETPRSISLGLSYAFLRVYSPRIPKRC